MKYFSLLSHVADYRVLFLRVTWNHNDDVDRVLLSETIVIFLSTKTIKIPLITEMMIKTLKSEYCGS